MTFTQESLTCEICTATGCSELVTIDWEPESVVGCRTCWWEWHDSEYIESELAGKEWHDTY